jgi:hypothetical protein
MTEQTDISRPAPVRTRWPLRGFLTATFIIVAGPPIGAILLVVPLFFMAGQHTVADFSPESVQNELWSYLSVSILMVTFSHFLGGVQAGLSAIWLGFRVFFRGTFGYGEAALVALVVSLIWAMRVSNPGALLDFRAVLSGDFGGEGFPLTLIAVSIVSALICRWLLRVVRILPE